MSYLTAEQKADIEARIATKTAQLTKANTALDAGLHEVSEFNLDTGDGSQKTIYRSLDEIKETITFLESEIDRLNRKLYGTGLVSMGLRRG